MEQGRPIRRSILFAALVVALASFAVASTLLGEVQLRGGKAVTVAADQVVTDDLYASGETVRIEGTVRGDLVAAGREIVVDGIVEGDVLAVGQSVTINGTVGDDIRIAGQVLHLGPKARVGDDLIAAGFSLETDQGDEVGGTVRFFGYQAALAGEVGENVGGSMGALRLAGSVHGNVDVEVGPRNEGAPPMFWPTPVPIPSVAPGLEVTDTARVVGALSYESPTEGAVAPAATVDGGVEYREKATEAEPEAGILERAAKRLRRLAALFIVGVLMLWLVPRWSERLADTVWTRPLPSLGWGVVCLAVAAVGAIAIVLAVALLAAALGVVTLGGLVAAVIGGGVLGELALVIAVLVACVYLAPVVVALAGGRWALARNAPLSGGRRFVALLFGVIVLVLLTTIPYLGGLVAILAMLLGLGSLWLWGVGRVRGGESV